MATVIHPAVGADDDFIIFGEHTDIIEDTIFSSNSYIYINQIDVNRSVHIENGGYLSGDIFIADGCSVAIRNHGIFDGDIYLGNNARIIQVINSRTDVTNLNIHGEHIIVVDRTSRDSDLRFSDVLSIGADKIILDNAMLGFDVVRALRDADHTIVLSGVVIFNIDATPDMDGIRLIENVSGGGTVLISAPDLDPLYIAVGRRDGNSVFMDVRRETDYKKILDSDIGEFINMVRDAGIGGKFIERLDGAKTRGEIDNILGRSGRTNPMRLMDVTHMINSYRMADMNIADGVSAHDFRVFSDDADVRGVNVGAGVRLGMVSLGIDGYLASVGYDGMDAYDGISYGGDVRMRIDSKYVWMRGAVGMAAAAFDDFGPVWNGHDAVWNVMGKYQYGILDIGTRVTRGGFYVTPMIGASVYHRDIAKLSAWSYAARGGVGAGYTYEIDGIGYDYAIRAVADSDRTVVAGISATAYSRKDGVFIDFGLDAYRDDVMTTLRLRLGGRVVF